MDPRIKKLSRGLSAQTTRLGLTRATGVDLEQDKAPFIAQVIADLERRYAAMAAGNTRREATEHAERQVLNLGELNSRNQPEALDYASIVNLSFS